jgi:hypothetical protein
MSDELKEKFDAVVHAPGKTRYFTKKIVTLVVGYCATSVVKTALRNVVLEEPSKTSKVKLSLGCYGIGSVVAASTKDVIGREVDDFFDGAEKYWEMWKKATPNGSSAVTPIVPPSE